MEDAEYHRMFAYEDAHWWFRGKRAVLAAMIVRWAPRRPDVRCLDVGCGTGRNLQLLASYGRAFGTDLSPLALDFTRRRGASDVTRSSATALPYRDDTFDVVTLLDVLYHQQVGDVAGSLREAHRVCRPGGLLLVTDSAFEWLKGPHDVAVHAARRFRREELAATIAESGFTVVKRSYMNALLFPIALAVRFAERRRFGSTAHSSLDLPSRPVNAALAAIYGLEARLLRHTSLPFGLSVLLAARKP